MEEMLALIKLTLMQVLFLVGIIIAVGLILGLIEKKSNENMFKAFGKAGILFTALIGTPVHELGHMLMCILFGHKIKKVSLLRFNCSDGVLGYVQHSFNPKNFYQRIGNFFIGVGPIFSGIGAIIGSLYLLLPDSFEVFQRYFGSDLYKSGISKAFFITVSDSVLKVMISIFSINNLTLPSFWIFIVVALSVSSHIVLSKADIKGARDGLIAFVILLLLINIAAKLVGVNTSNYIAEVSKYNIYILSFSSLALMFSLIMLMISYVFRFIFSHR